jgi:hypothetical protein
MFHQLGAPALLTGAPGSEIADSYPKDVGVVLEHAQSGVALIAQKTTDALGAAGSSRAARMVMVDMPYAISVVTTRNVRPADRTSTILRSDQLFILSYGQPAPTECALPVTLTPRLCIPLFASKLLVTGLAVRAGTPKLRPRLELPALRARPIPADNIPMMFLIQEPIAAFARTIFRIGGLALECLATTAADTMEPRFILVTLTVLLL